MNKYKLSEMVNRRRGTAVLMPIIPESLTLEKAYLAELRRLLKDIGRLMNEVVMPSYESRLVKDADEGTFDALRRMIGNLLRSVNSTVGNLLKLESSKHTVKFTENARRTFGVSLLGILKEEDLDDYMEQVTLRNTGLIKGMTDDLVRRAQSVVTTAMIEQRPPSQLRKDLAQALRVSDSRAKLIARDQAAKFNSELNEIRHRQAGIERYVWRTSLDERVRARHAKLEGIEYEYGERTGAEEGLPPGRPIQCRCIAQAVVTFGDTPKEKRLPINPDNFEAREETYVHYTSSNAAESIMKEGFRASDGILGKGVYLVNADSPGEVDINRGHYTQKLQVQARQGRYAKVGEGWVGMKNWMNALPKEYQKLEPSEAGKALGYLGFEIEQGANKSWLLVIDPKDLRVVKKSNL